jgi:hypothetical protein
MQMCLSVLIADFLEILQWNVMLRGGQDVDGRCLRLGCSPRRRSGNSSISSTVILLGGGSIRGVR